METIKVNRVDLIAKIETNREKHEAEFNQAVEVWVKKATKALAKAAKKAEEKGWIDTDVLAGLPKPQSYLQSYEDALARLNMDVREEIELEDREFSAWVQDNWVWRGAFHANTSMYNG